MSHSKSPDQESRLEADNIFTANQPQSQTQGQTRSQSAIDPGYSMNRFLSEPPLPGLSPRGAQSEQEARIRSELRQYEALFNKPHRRLLYPSKAPNREAEGREMKDVPNQPDAELELHLSHMIDDLVNNIIRLQPDDQTCETTLTLLPQLLLLFAMRGYYQSKIPAEVGMWLFVEKNRQ